MEGWGLSSRDYYSLRRDWETNWSQNITWLCYAALPPGVVLPALTYSTAVLGDHLFELGPGDVLATDLYPDFEFRTVSSVLDTML
jgi:hypothetical protein